jgi:hypothetical protein
MGQPAANCTMPSRHIYSPESELCHTQLTPAQSISAYASLGVLMAASGKYARVDSEGCLALHSCLITKEDLNSLFHCMYMKCCHLFSVREAATMLLMQNRRNGFLIPAKVTPGRLGKVWTTALQENGRKSGT